MEFLLLRPAQITREILDILNVLTPTSKLSISEARNIITIQLKNNHYTYVGYEDGVPVCMGSFIILVKLGQNGGKSCLIEDIVVKPDKQGKHYGYKLMEFLLKKVETYDVYKVILNCKFDLEGFYVKNGFYKSGLYMRKDY